MFLRVGVCVRASLPLGNNTHHTNKTRRTGKETMKPPMGGAAISSLGSMEPYYSIIIAILCEIETEISRRTVDECHEPAV